LINVLGRVPGLRVKGRTSSFNFKDQKLPAQEIAEQLGVAYLLRGGVRKAGNKVRITAGLSHAATDEIVWSSEPFERDLTDVFAVQSEIAGLVAKNLAMKLGASSAASTAPVNPQALELYLQGREAWKLRTTAGYDQAEELLNRALALEPNFARALSALADVWSTRGQDDGSIGRFDGRASPQQTRIVAKIRQALVIDPDSVEARASLGCALWLGWNTAEGVRELRHAISLNPNYASAHQWLGRALLSEGRVDEALTELKLAAEIDPMSSRLNDNLGMGLFMAGRYEEALVAYDRAIGLQVVSLQAFSQKAWLLAEWGRPEEATTLARSLLEGVFITRPYKVLILARAGYTAEAETLLASLDEGVGDRARFLLAVGRRDDALDKLHPAEVPATAIDQWLFAPFVDRVRNDPRFVTFIATLGLTEAHARAQAWRAAHPPQFPARN
jgi:tetratricopeptide (TPR) repeat protein